MTLSRADIAGKIVLICHRLSEREFVSATDGNVSARLPNGNILITPSSVHKGDVGESMLVEVKPDGAPVTLSRSASTELPMHLFIYRERPDVRAVVHAHPVYATGFAVARIPLDAKVLPEVILGLGSVPLADYATPSTEELPAALAPHVKTSDAVLMANHGVVAYGSSVEEAYFKLEKVEQAAHITFVARMLGGEHHLSPEEIRKLQATSSSIPKHVLPPADADHGRQELSEEEVKSLIRTTLSNMPASRS
ncbi:MAG TPA: class II aldolase/adducin family protein [Bacteroidota bacterium]